MPRITAVSCPVLCDNEIHIHLIPPENVEQVSSDTYLDKLECNRAQQLILEKDRFLFRASHIFLRQLLSCYGKPEPETWQFKCSPHGKPRVNNPGYQHLKFNLSHTLGLIAVAVGKKHELGVDIEQHRPIKELSGICRYALSEAECQNVLQGDDEALKKQRFYRYWTLKEAYAKARGEGLSTPLQNISFVPIKHNEWALHTNQNTETEEKDIRLLSSDYPEGYSLALAAEYQAANEQPNSHETIPPPSMKAAIADFHSNSHEKISPRKHENRFADFHSNIQLIYWEEQPSYQELEFNVFPA